MAAGDARVADTVHHKIDSMVHSHYVYKSVWSPVIGWRTIHPGEGACWPYSNNKFAIAVIKDSQIVRHTPSENLFIDYVTQRGSVVRYPVSVILLGEEGKEKG